MPVGIKENIREKIRAIPRTACKLLMDNFKKILEKRMELIGAGFTSSSR